MAETEQATPLPTLEENIHNVLETLPKPLQDFLTSPERDAVTIRITKRYNLHADQAGEFQRAFLFMLMGIFTPEEFVNDLTTTGIHPDTIASLTKDVNDEVFKPLQEKERQIWTPAPQPVAPQRAFIPEPVPLVQVVTTPTAPAAAIPAPYAGARPQPLTPFNLPGADAHPDDLFRSSTRTVAPLPPTAVPVPPITAAAVSEPAPTPTYVEVPPTPIPPRIVAPAPQPSPVAPALMPVEKVSISPQPRSDNQSALGGTLRTMATDMLAVNEHRTPEPIQYKGTVYTPPVFMEAPANPVPKAPLNRIQTPPQSVPAPSVPNTQTRPTVTPTPVRELVKEYSSDPYREPV